MVAGRVHFHEIRQVRHSRKFIQIWVGEILWCQNEWDVEQWLGHLHSSTAVGEPDREREREREREIKFIGLFGDRGHRGPYSPYKRCNHNLYIGIIIFPHIDSPQSTGYNHPKKKTIKIINKKSEGPINLTNHWRKRLWISLHMDLKKT